MTTTSYDDYKYMLNDISNLYIGAKYSYRELMENPEVNFKLKSVLERYILTETEADTSLESDFYYMKKDSFVCRTYEQLKVKIKCNIMVEKKSIIGSARAVYQEKTFSLRELVEMPLAVKKRDGLMIQEIIFSKLALISFVI